MDYFKMGIEIFMILLAIEIISSVLWFFLYGYNPSIAGLILEIGMGSMVLGILTLFLIFLMDIITAKNDISWKLLWGIVVIFIVGLGWIFYLMIGRKERKE